MDKNVQLVFIALLTKSFLNHSDNFKATNAQLREMTGLSKRVVEAALSALHREKLIMVEPAGQTTKKNITKITLNRNSWNRYDKVTDISSLIGTPEIVTDNYNESGYSPSYVIEKEFSKILNS